MQRRNAWENMLITCLRELIQFWQRQMIDVPLDNPPRGKHHQSKVASTKNEDGSLLLDVRILTNSRTNKPTNQHQKMRFWSTVEHIHTYGYMLIRYDIVRREGEKMGAKCRKEYGLAVAYY